jgi:phage FluMu protein Com
MNINNAYNIFKNILSGCKTMVDAIYFVDKIIKLCPESRDLLIGMIHNKKYDKSYDIRSMAHVLNQLDLQLYREDIDEFIDKNIKSHVDLIQLTSLIRLSKFKSIKIHDKQDKQINVTFNNISNDANEYDYITKKCPHCGIQVRLNNMIEYVICGYIDNNKGYDWNGCGKDWCAKCNKMLCKSWDHDQLFITINRSHDKKCCEKYAHDNNINYELFCSC